MTQACKQSVPKKMLSKKAKIDRLLKADLFKALSDPTRLLLLSCLSKCARACSLSEISECCKVDLSVVSRHMSQLQNAGLVSSEKQGRTVLFETRFSEVIKTFRELAEGFEECCPEITKNCKCC